ncbi:DNA circularization N-terminal domain-containing protein [Methylobacterium durans]|uniref:DNA circulation N-terminal domain-containing protein n=1 Tax=Methylobacterium durans TaxID=2202825 RepID=A0A2U8WCK1_9HYPH|nr:DNA circularization N-terminal domain-containing protein [Methylobacterium durans]AWN43170.1 hypothetical protein DK389_25080 [Methylobacterium durans]
MADSPWRARLRPASFRGAEFHVEVGTRAGGRRVALHEFAKRDDPYAEDMGRRAIRNAVTAYLVGPDYLDDRDILIESLDAEGPGLLIHPTLGEFDVVCDGFNAIERRERGGYVEIECTFIEVGSIGSYQAQADTAGAVGMKADDLSTASGAFADSYVNTDSLDLGAGRDTDWV